MTIVSQADDDRQSDGEAEPVQIKLSRAERWAVLGGGLPVVLAGGALSWSGQYAAASTAFNPPTLGILVPLAVDGLILYGSAGWVVAIRAGRRAGGFRATAHLGIALSILLNLYAVVDDPALIPWHIGGPISVSLILEVLANYLTNRRRREVGDDTDRIPVRLWLSAPVESWRTTLRMARTGVREASIARAQAGAGRAAILAVRLVVPAERFDRASRGMRREITRRILDGSLTAPEAVEVVDQLAAERHLGPRERAYLDTLRSAASRDGSDRIGGSVGSDREPEAIGSAEPVGVPEVEAAPSSAEAEAIGSDPTVTVSRESLQIALERLDVGDLATVRGRLAEAIPGPSASAGARAVGVVAASGGRQSVTAQTGKQARPEDIRKADELIASGALKVDHRGVPTNADLMAALNIGPTYGRLTRKHYERKADQKTA